MGDTGGGKQWTCGDTQPSCCPGNNPKLSL